MKHDTFRNETPVTIPIPSTAKAWDKAWRDSTCSRMAVIQFYVPHIGFREEWAWCPNDQSSESFLDGFTRTIVNMARNFYEKQWPGTSKDMICTGGAFWTGTGFNLVRHMRDIP